MSVQATTFLTREEAMAQAVSKLESIKIENMSDDELADFLEDTFNNYVIKQ